MISTADALLEIDSALDMASADIIRELEHYLEEGTRVTPEDIAAVLLDSSFSELSHNIEDVLHDLLGTEENRDEDDTADIVHVQTALENAQQQLWEVFSNFFQGEEFPSEEEATEAVNEVFWELREEIAQVVEAHEHSSSSSTEDGWGVVLPITRRRRAGGPLP